MPRRLPEPPYDLAAEIPEFAPLAKETVLLYARTGDPGPRDSSLGGPLLWPAGEPWPYCARPGHWIPSSQGELRPGPVPMVALVQLFARDIPQLEFPQGKDVLQLLWCTLIHEDDEQAAVLPRLHWRNEAEVLAAGPLEDMPVPGPGEFFEDFLPTPPCTVCPTPATEYPACDLPEELRESLEPRLSELEERFGCWYTEVASALQNKVGGYPAWTQSPDWPHCDRGHRMEHLLSIAGEPGYGRWLPLDDHLPGVTEPTWDAPADPAVEDTLGPQDMVMGDMGGVYVFLCRRCPELPYAHRYDCH